ncbi:DUF1302 domain-containing protein [Paludibacterium paludis]|uniref:DUF1302 domain-containing protein n=1 Tax=Paludibacterium paludis TaxID=1225769 RepID=A0A918P4Z6_9NEIS|nr:DUF1302 domain-containing protein [Paludibacterium paludis]GGY23744.1 hypothetical protein GCM10011289_29270 [Paludibacterium paludis]
MTTRFAAGAAMALVWPALSCAVTFETDALRGSVDSTITLGFAARTDARDCRFIGQDNGGCGPDPELNFLNGDDGDRNYNRGDLFSLYLKGLHELSVKTLDGASGALVRASWLHDWRAGKTRAIPLASDARRQIVTRTELLDAFVFHQTELAGHRVQWRLGNQVVSWGEDLFILGGVNTINAIDSQRAHLPGTPVKEILRPAPMLALNGDLGAGWSAEAYWQFKWNSWRMDPAGSYFSTMDTVGKGARGIYFGNSLSAQLGPDIGAGLATPDIPGGKPFFPYAGENRPGARDRQYGMALRYKPDDAGSELAFYYLRYNDKMPQVGFRQFGKDPVFGLPQGEIFMNWGTRRELFGLSGHTSLGDLALGSELSYRPRDSVGIVAPVDPLGRASFTSPGYATERKWQWNVSAVYSATPSNSLSGLVSLLGASQVDLSAEAAVVHYPGLNPAPYTPDAPVHWDFSRGGKAYFVPYPRGASVSKTSWGYVLQVSPQYPGIFGSNLTFTPELSVSHDVKGISPNTIPFVAGRKAATLNLNLSRTSQWKASLGYTTFWGGGLNNPLSDRDFVSASFSVNF